MKNKKVLFVLVPAVIAVYGLIFYKFFANDKEESEVFDRSYKVENHEISNSSDSVEMIWVYRDPFLDKTRAIKNNENIEQYVQSFTNSNSNISISKEVNDDNKTKTRSVKWPSIKYMGLIINNKNGKVLSVFNINQKDIFLSIKDSVYGVTLIEANAETATMEYKNELKVFKK